MKHHTTTTRTITVESYVTVRSEWPTELAKMVSTEFNARGLRVVDDNTEWRYFKDEESAKKWADAVHNERNIE